MRGLNSRRKSPPKPKVREKFSAAERLRLGIPTHRLNGKPIPKVGGCYAESVFAAKAKARGAEVIRGGWPDFIILDGGKPTLVEVKSTLDKLSDWQRKNFAALELAGVKVKVWWEECPDCLMPWKKFDRLRKQKGAAARRAAKDLRKDTNPGMYTHQMTERLERQRL